MEMRWMMLRCYSELLQLPTFKERYEYLRLDGVVGEETFGFDRYLNQIFYNSQEWKDIRRKIIIRDNGCDLGLDGYEIRGKILIHHMNPIRQQDILLRTDLVLNPEYLIATTLSTHNAIHYGDEKLLLTIIHKFGGGPVGLDTLAASIGEDRNTIEDVYEPYLLQLGFINRGPRGRIAMPKAYEHLNIEYPKK